jgi:hypothetical protein
VLCEIRVHDRRKKGPAGVFCAVDADSVDARVLVEEGRDHVARKGKKEMEQSHSDGPVTFIQITNRTPAEK